MGAGTRGNSEDVKKFCVMDPGPDPRWFFAVGSGRTIKEVVMKCIILEC